MASKSTACLRYKDKVTVITGGSKGIGEGCVRVFGRFSGCCETNYVHNYVIGSLRVAMTIQVSKIGSCAFM